MEIKKSNFTKTTEVPADKPKTAIHMSAKTRKWMNAALIIIGVVIFALVNVLATVIVDKNPSLLSDWTETSYGLSDTTKEYLEYLDRDISIQVLKSEVQLVSVETDYGYGYQANMLLKKMSAYDNIDMEYTEILTTSVKTLNEKYPDVDWTSPNNLLLITDKQTGRYKAVNLYEVFAATYDDDNEIFIYGQAVEQSVLTAIQYVITDQTVKVGLSTGNGEFFNSESDFYSDFAKIPYFLLDNAYETEEINLFTQTPPEDMDVIIMMAPRTDLTNEQVNVLNSWLTNDGEYGKTLVYVPHDQVPEELTNLELFLEQWGMKQGDGFISESDGDRALSLGDNRSDLFPLMDYYDTTYTTNIKTDLDVLMPHCIPVEITNENVATPLLVSSDTASVRINANSDDVTEEETIPSDGNPLVGAAIGVKSGEDSSTYSSVIYWGAYDGLRDKWTYNYGENINNMTYFINLLNETARENSASILVESADLGGDSLLIKSSQMVTIGIIFIFVLPIAIIVFGIVVWVRRRHR